MYNVVFRNISGSDSHGAITWTTFGSEEAFVEWYDHKMRGWYEVVDRGVSGEHAIELCSTPEANLAAMDYQLRQASRIVRGLLERA